MSEIRSYGLEQWLPSRISSLLLLCQNRLCQRVHFPYIMATAREIRAEMIIQKVNCWLVFNLSSSVYCFPLCQGRHQGLSHLYLTRAPDLEDPSDLDI
jgi:hypothetical protein